LSESVRQHREAAPERVRVAVLTISDTRTPENDTGGDTIRNLLIEAGHEIAGGAIVKDEVEQIETRIDEYLSDPAVDAVITTGGTGISARDTTYEVVSRKLDKTLDGFGEIFRVLSYEEVGAAAMLSRATAGAAGAKFLACLPGSSNAVRLAMEKLLVPEIAHVVFELKRHR
jgi:molybdenum cofactor biosynthesis protein B